MKLVALFSGGKDSCFAVYRAVKEGHTVQYLVSIISENPESYMFHYPNIEFVKYQAESMGIRLITRKTQGRKEEELHDLLDVLKELKGIDGVVVGGLASEYQRSRIKRICDSLGLKTYIPYWNIDPEKYWEDILNAGFKVMIVSVACEGLDKSWLGRVIDKAGLEELKKLGKKYNFHLGFEGGEAETFVIDCPLFRKRIEILDAETRWSGDSGVYLFKRVRLVDKPNPS